MSKIVSTKTKKTNAVFLAAILIAGTFALIFPSFMTGAEAYPDYEMDNKKYKSKYPSYGYHDDYKSKYPDKDKDKKDVIVKKVKCNNININLNGIEIGFPGDLTSGLSAQAQAEEDDDEQEVGTANILPNDESSSNKFNFDDNFVFICINNNNNAGQGENDELNQCAEDIRACFEEFLSEGQFPRFVAALESGITVEINGEDVTLRSFEDICSALEGLTFEQLKDAIPAIVNAALAPPGGVVPIRKDLINCIAEALDIPIPR